MSGVPRISPEEAHAKMTAEGYTYVDIRSEEEFALGHPAGAINVPIGEDFVDAMTARFAKDAPIVLGCKAGVSSAHAAKTLALAGFTRLADQRAGWDGERGTFGEIALPGWSRIGLPCEP